MHLLIDNLDRISICLFATALLIVTICLVVHALRRSPVRPATTLAETLPPDLELCINAIRFYIPDDPAPEWGEVRSSVRPLDDGSFAMRVPFGEGVHMEIRLTTRPIPMPVMVGKKEAVSA